MIVRYLPGAEELVVIVGPDLQVSHLYTNLIQFPSQKISNGQQMKMNLKLNTLIVVSIILTLVEVDCVSIRDSIVRELVNPDNLKYTDDEVGFDSNITVFHSYYILVDSSWSCSCCSK